VRTLVAANAANASSQVHHVYDLLTQVKSGWDTIGADPAAAG